MTHRPRWPTSRQTIAFCVLIAMLAPSVAYFLSRNDLNNTIETQTELIDDLRGRLEVATARLDADQAETNCIRTLSGNKSSAETQVLIANSNLIIAVAVRGDVAKALTEIDTTTKTLVTADAAYSLATTEGVDVARDCPGG